MTNYQVIGTIERDAEVREVNGKPYISYTVCSAKEVYGKEMKNWVDIMQSSNNAHFESKRYKKGVVVYAQGNPSVSAYINKSGEPKASQSVWTNSFNVHIIEKGFESQSSSNYSEPETSEPQPSVSTSQVDPADDLPF